MAGPQVSATILASALTGSFADLVTVTGPARIVILSSDCDVPFLVSFGDDTNPLRLPANTSFTLDLGANSTQAITGIRVKHDGVAGNAARKISALLIQEPR